MRARNLKLIILLASFSLLASACSISTTSSTSGQATADSSIFVSSNRGDNWQVAAKVPTTNGQAQNLDNLNVNVITMDPSDSAALYLASFDHGLFYTYNIKEGWQEVSGLPKTTINDVKVDPKNKCVIYASVANRLYRSVDCARTWTESYFDNNAGVSVNAIAVDHYNSNNIYIGTSRGEIIKSLDGGSSWRTIQRLNEGVARLIVSPLDSRLIFVASASNKIYSFVSNTDTNPDYTADLEGNFLVEEWTDLNDVLDQYNLGSSFKDIVVCAKDGAMFLATDKLILRSVDNGITWENINLIQPEKEAIINAIAVDPQDSNNLYYVTNTTFFKSTDGGVTWATKKLPTKRAGRELLIDFNNPNVVYLGTIQLKK